MINTIREKIFRFVAKRQAARSASMPKWEDVRSVAVIYPNDNIQHIVKQLEADNKEVVVFTLPKKEEINWLTEKPKKEVISMISRRKYEVMIDLTQETNRTLQYIAMCIKTDFKVGRGHHEEIYDMVIDTPKQDKPDYLFEQVVRYMKMFGN